MVELRRLGGAAGRPPAVANAAGNRQAGFTLFNAAPLMPGIEAAMKDSCDNVVAAMAPHGNGKSMLNFLTDHDGTVDRVRTAFEPEAYARLAALKKTSTRATFSGSATTSHPRPETYVTPTVTPESRVAARYLRRESASRVTSRCAPAAPRGLACRGSYSPCRRRQG